ncbi:MAG: glutaredoxin 3 [Burkholderiales bacterium]|nr:glutaredoxin 3 [Burkholderiales bacterium]
MNPVRMYATATCPYCLRAKALLQQRGVREIDEIRVDLEPDRRRQMIERTGRYTVPQIFIGQTHVGGCDDLIELDRRGGLLPLLAGDSA